MSHHRAILEHQEMTARDASFPVPTAALCPLLSAMKETTNIAFKKLPQHTLGQTTALLAKSIMRIQQGRPPSLLLPLLSALCSLQPTRKLTLYSSSYYATHSLQPPPCYLRASREDSKGGLSPCSCGRLSALCSLQPRRQLTLHSSSYHATHFIEPQPC